MKNLRLSVLIALFLMPILSSASTIKFTCDMFDIIDVRISGDTRSSGDVYNAQTAVQIMDVYYAIKKEDILVNRISTSRGFYFEYLYKNKHSESDDFIYIIADEEGNALTNMIYKGIAFENKKTYCRFEK